MTPEDVVEIVDGASQQLVIDLENPESLPGEGTATGQMTTMASAPSKARVPHWTRSNGSKIWPKYYVYDPDNKNGRNQARKGWHDYCTGLKFKYRPDIGAPDSAKFQYPSGNPRYPNYTSSVSFRGPCARHDLCIQYKQAPTRYYCDDELKTHIRMNCRYYIRADLYPSRKKGLEASYARAGFYHYWVRYSTGGNTDSGKWGQNQYTSVWPTYRYDDWTQ